MSVIRVTSQMQHFDYLQCKCCHAVLPVAAVFCSQCGMRVDKDEISGSNTPLSSQSEIAARYRILSLIRRRPAIQLSFALDTQLQRLIMLRDIDVSKLDEAARRHAYTELQQEYDLLRRQNIKGIMPLIASHNCEDHLYSVAGWPFSQSEGGAIMSNISSSLRPYTLHDLLQSGIGLPSEQIAVSWIADLAQVVERLHECQIVIGELDPDTLIVSSYDYSSDLALMVSWLPVAIRHTLSQISHPVHPSRFRAPEAVYGQEDKLADIYSLGALLYLLLTGTAPDSMRVSNSKRYRIRSPRALNSHVSRNLDAIVMQALALEPGKRFQHAYELGEALFDLRKKVRTARRSRSTFPHPPKSTPNFVEETFVSSDMDNNETKGSKEATLPGQEPNDETIQIEDIQEQLARSYWSRINTGPLRSHEKLTGEVTVDKVQIQDKQIEDAVEHTFLINNALKNEGSKGEGKKIKNSKRLSNRKKQVLSEQMSEVADSPEVQDEIGQATALAALVADTPVDLANIIPSLEVSTDATTEKVLVVSLSGGMAEEQNFIELVEAEQSAEEVLHQEASIDTDQSQELVEEKEEETLRIGLVEEEITTGQEPEEAKKEGSVKQELVENKEEEIIKKEFSTGQELVKELTIEQGRVDVEDSVIPKQEQVSEEEPLQQEAVEAEEDIISEQAGIEEKATEQQEKHQSDEIHEEHAVSSSRALVAQSTSHSEMLPALLPERSKRRGLARIKDLFVNSRALLTRQMQLTGENTNQDGSFLQRVQRFILGEQKHTTMAAALIETPMRIRPTQGYAIRIQVIGRDQLKDKTQTGGLTALKCGDIVHIEVRLALYQSYAYMIQQADVAIPASGYAAEVTVPMHPLSSGPASRRERLYIFFMDKEHNPLYEKPFVIELFVSPLVQLGHEGHNVLSIPI